MHIKFFKYSIIIIVVIFHARYLNAQISANSRPFTHFDYIPQIPADVFINTLRERQRLEAERLEIIKRKQELDNYYRTRTVPSDYQSVTFYANFPDFGNLIEIWINGEYHSWISNGYYTDGSGCNSNSERAVYRFYGKPGIYNVIAVSANNLRWEFTITVEFDRCKTMAFSKS